MSGSRTAHAIALVIVAASVAAWLATGREAFTRWPNARLEAADAPVSIPEEDLLGEIGMETEPASAQTAVESRFAFGLLPSGPDPAHLVSLATCVLASSLISGTALLVQRMRRTSVV